MNVTSIFRHIFSKKTVSVCHNDRQLYYKFLKIVVKICPSLAEEVEYTPDVTNTVKTVLECYCVAV